MADQKDMSVFDSGDVNPYNKFFTGESYLKMLSTEQVPVGNVTFEPGAATTGISTTRRRAAARFCS